MALRTTGALKTGIALSAMVLSAGAASAGGFAPKEQSTVFLGSAFAGSAAGGALSSMFWNPAALGQFDGINSESAYSLILPDTEITVPGAGAFGKSGDIGDTAVLPASYFSYQLNNQAVLGMSVNAPFGLTTDGKFNWAGSQLARESKIATYNFAPTLAYRVSPGVTVGAGLQVEFIDAQLRSAFGSSGGPTAAIKGDDWGFGFTAGILLTPATGTSVGLGFRSKIDHNLEGTFHVPGAVNPSPVSADVSLPEIVTLSLRQDIAPAWTLLGTVEWTNWSRLPELRVTCDNGIAGVCAKGGPVGGVPLTLNWDDGWFFSAGLEHAYSEQLTLRAGAAYEISPIDTDAGRTIRVPDADRIWVTAGASYKYSEFTTVDLSYAHVFVEDATTVQAGGAFVGQVESSADIISVGVRSKLDWILSGG
jgi:long-chain fatty acid transport protein